MSDMRTREFRTQLTTIMESALRRSMFEIMRIFENTLHDHQVELGQKGEEIAQLKIKLQRAELKLKEGECGGDTGVEMYETRLKESQKEPEDVLNALGQTSDVPEIDFEVPDDWCAPLGCETGTKQQDGGVCPSVRLRPLYIPLWHVKQEMVDRDISSSQKTKVGRKSKRGSSLKEKQQHTQDRSPPVRDQGAQRPPLSNEIRELLQGVRHVYADLIDSPTGLRRRGRSSAGKEQKNTPKRKRDSASKSKSTESETMENEGEKKYSCKFCDKVFDTLFGRSVHVRSHKRCRGCKKEFPFPSVLNSHKPYCMKLKKLVEKEAQPSDPPKPQPGDEEKPAAPSKKQVIKKDNAPSSSAHSEPSFQKHGPTDKYPCVFCSKKFQSRSRMKDHMRVHTGEKPFPCSACPKKFRVRQSLKLHTMRMHKDHVNSSETNGGLAWTMPLEVTEDGKDGLISPSKDTSRLIDNNTKVQSDHDLERKPKKRSKWQTMGKQIHDGYICLVCHKTLKSKQLLIEHFHVHKGEKTVKCDTCSAKFHSRGQLSMHKKRCGKPVGPAIQCEKCDRKFLTQKKCDRHVDKFHREWPNSCQVCGKGFMTVGRLRNHMEQHK